MRHHQASKFYRLLQCIVMGAGLTVSMSCLADDVEYEDYTFRNQATYVWQHNSAFSALYSGPNSLNANANRSYTATITGYWGFRPWQGGELYLNPEITQGVPFSGLTGAANFTNGELTRTAAAKPKLYRQRLFLRQTFNQGGGEEKIESSLNQMAGTVDKNRFVLTVGNFSTLDVFDNNAYAKDPRSQFMGAGFMAPLAYDYAADARGFSWGFTGEWYQGDWVYRFGRMTGPKRPNELPMELRVFKYFGDQVEVEHAHTLFGEPGKVRLLAWRNRANIASFQDALNYLNNNPGADPQAIFAVRSDKIKYGYGINVEQAINKDLGFFLRAMQTDGKTETLAFVESDASIGTGFSLKGTSWQRPKDTVGLGYLYSMISDDRRRYLEAGGISYFIGDGHLNYRPEQTFEVYYSANVYKDFNITADYQHMQNPAYNADRGPVDFVALRVHVDF